VKHISFLGEKKGKKRDLKKKIRFHMDCTKRAIHEKEKGKMLQFRVR